MSLADIRRHVDPTTRVRRQSSDLKRSGGSPEAGSDPLVVSCFDGSEVSKMVAKHVKFGYWARSLRYLF